MALLTTRGAALVAMAAWSVTACHAVFDGELGRVTCEAEGTRGPPACPEGEVCREGVCQMATGMLGALCASDADCDAPHVCFSPADAGEEGLARCTRPCCTSSDCGDAAEGQICWSPSGGTGSLCWPAAEEGRGLLGRLGAGASCEASTDCRSGLCEGGRCVDGCCTDASCEGELVCRVRATAALGESWTCGLPPNVNSAQTVCDTDVDCRHAACRDVPGFDEGKLCMPPCCSSLDCGTIEVGGAYPPIACVVGPDGLRGCAEVLTSLSVEAVGAPCQSDDECRSGFCLRDGEASYCSDLCCDDASCGDGARFACRGGDVNGVWSLRCVRK